MAGELAHRLMTLSVLAEFGSQPQYQAAQLVEYLPSINEALYLISSVLILGARTATPGLRRWRQKGQESKVIKFKTSLCNMRPYSKKGERERGRERLGRGDERESIE